MAAFFGRFIDLYESLYGFPKPVVAALSGHTFAGGAILAIACDFRIMAEGDFGFALNEINLGLALSPTIRRMLADAVGVARVREVVLFGEPLPPGRALEIGFVRELAPAAYREIKRSLRESGGREDTHTDRATLGQFLDMWFSAEAQDARRAVASRV